MVVVDSCSNHPLHLAMKPCLETSTRIQEKSCLTVNVLLALNIANDFEEALEKAWHSQAPNSSRNHCALKYTGDFMNRSDGGWIHLRFPKVSSNMCSSTSSKYPKSRLFRAAGAAAIRRFIRS